MLLFRLFAPFFWFWAVRVLPDVLAVNGGVDQVDADRSHMRPRMIAVGTGLAVSLVYLLLRAAVPLTYEARFLFLHYFIVDWLPLLLIPAFMWTLLQHRRAAVFSIIALAQMQFAALLGVLWLEALLHGGVWTPYELFVRPLGAMFLTVIPIVAFRWAEKAVYGRKRHLVWFLPPLLAAAAAGVQLLFRVQRVALGSAVAAGCILLAGILLQRYSRYAKPLSLQPSRDV